MTRIAPPLGSAPSRSKPVSVQRVVNMYAQKAPDGGTVPFWLVGCPGLKNVVTLPTAPVRGLAVFGSVLYAIGGQTLYRISADGVATAMGGSLIPDGPVYMAAGLNQLVIVAGGNGYWINKTNDFVARITDLDFPGASSVDYLDGYFIFTKPDSGQWFISALLDATQFDALDFATAESKPDNLVRVLVSHNEVWLFGSSNDGPPTIEVWRNTGAADFPFERYSPVAVDRGIGAAASAVNADNSTLWVGDDDIVYRADGYTPIAISNAEVSAAIAGSSDKAAIVGFTWTQEGHVFYALRIPGVGVWVFDAATQQWHERETFGRDTWRAACYGKAYGRHFVGDDTTGGIYEFDFGIYTDGGDVMHADIYSPTIWADDQRFQVHRWQADFEVGVGLTTGQGNDPQVMLQFSGDGGFTWGNERWAPLGPIGQRYQRSIWRRCGQHRQLTARMRISDPVKRAFRGWTADVAGASV